MEKSVIGICFLILLSSCVASVNSAESPLMLKWQITLPTGYGHFHPCMGDVDGDGTQEIVIKYGDYVHVLSGDTGALEWKSPKDGVGDANILELADLNIDGIPEIVYCGTNLSVYARDGFGKLLWTSKRVSGESWPGTAVVASDTNGDKYPEIYVVTVDTTQPYSACITKLDNHGNILVNSEICYKPCWGGLSLADADFNGRFEVYLGDRASRGGPGGVSNSYPDNPARGLSCYDADTLETIWVRPDLYHSTPAPVLVDVTGDGILEVIGNNILNNGACVVDAITGQDIYNWKGQPINNHAKGTVWDIDLDGHVELISAWGYSDDARCTKDFTVLDLVTGNLDYRASEINNWITYPPTVGDINDDGYLEILVATSGEEGHGEVGQGMFYAYNNKYQIIQVVNDFPYGEQLWEPYCVDSDSDGLNEVLIGNNKGKVWCYDTPAQRPDGAPKCWSAWYSPYRQGAYAMHACMRTFDVVLGDTHYPVSIRSNSTVSNFNFDETEMQISFNVDGESGTIGYCNVTIPKSLLTGSPWIIKVDDTTVTDFDEKTNDTHTFLYFTYTHESPLQVTIEGTWVVPEFPSAIILPLFMILSLITVVFVKLKKKKQ